MEAFRKATKEDIESLKKDLEVLRKVTKEDMEKLEAELKSYVDVRIDAVNRRIDDLYGVTRASLVAIVVTLASTILVPVILRAFF
jgi:LPS O-antigen subunit length determinant protein (WzzB/FepE family)